MSVWRVVLDLIGPYLDNRKEYLRSVVKPLQDRNENVYVSQPDQAAAINKEISEQNCPACLAARLCRRQYFHIIIRERTRLRLLTAEPKPPNRTMLLGCPYRQPPLEKAKLSLFLIALENQAITL